MTKQKNRGSDVKEDKIKGKMKTIPLYLHIPESYYNDIEKISFVTGLSKKSVIVELLRPAIKLKLKELEEYM